MSTWDGSLGAAEAAIQACKGHMAQLLLAASQSREKCDEILSQVCGPGERGRPRQINLLIARDTFTGMERSMVQNFETADNLLRAIRSLRNDDGND